MFKSLAFFKARSPPSFSKLYLSRFSFASTNQQNSNGVSFRLSYFGIGGRGAPLRMAASIGNISYEDYFITKAEHRQSKMSGERRWVGLPEITVFDQDDNELVTIGQSNACLRYVGSLCNLYPDNPVNRALVDEILESVEDFSGMLGPSLREKDHDKKKQMRLELLNDDKFPYLINKFEQRFTENENRGNKNGYIVGDSLTIADIKIYFMIKNLKSGDVDYIDGDKLLLSAKRLLALEEIFKSNNQVQKFESDFKEQQIEFKTNQTKVFKRNGTTVSGFFN